MARLIVHAVVGAAGQARPAHLIVSVSHADDGAPRSGLLPEHFAVHQVAAQEPDAATPRLVEQVVEGPAGVYGLRLAAHETDADRAAGQAIFAVAVGGAEQAPGWGDAAGQTLAS